MKIKIVSVVFLLIYIMYGGYAGAANLMWSTYRGNDHRSGITDAHVSFPLELKWKHKALYPPNPSWPKPAKRDWWHEIPKLAPTTIYDRVFHPVIFNGKVAYSSSADNTIHCLGLKTGKELWHFITDGPVRVAPAYKDGRLYVGSDDGYLYCLNADDGKEIWKFWAGDENKRLFIGNSRLISRQPVRTGVVFKDGLVYVAAGLFQKEGIFLSAIDCETGEKKYKVKIRRPAQGYITLFDDKISFPVGRTSQAAFALETGREIFSFAPGTQTAVYNNLFFTGTNERGYGVLYSIENGKKTTIATLKAHQIVVLNDNLYVFTPQQILAYKKADFIKASSALTKLHAVKNDERDEAWQKDYTAANNLKKKSFIWKCIAKNNLAVIAIDDSFFVGCQDSVLCINKQTGTINWSEETDGKIYGLAAIDGYVLASSDTGSIYCFKSVKKKTVAKKQKIAVKKQVKEAVKEKPHNERIYDKSLVSSWIFSKKYKKGDEIIDIKGLRNVFVPDTATFISKKGIDYVRVNGDTIISVGTEENRDILPSKEITIEALVNIAQPVSWGGIIGAFQDNGDVEFGWVLGYRNKRFMFGLNSVSSKKLTYLQAPTDFNTTKWYYVVGTYDGSEMCLYINGEKVATSRTQNGDIRYSPTFYYDIATYHDENENNKLKGGLMEIAVYSSALDAQAIRDNATSFEKKLHLFENIIDTAVIDKDEPGVSFSHDGMCTISFTRELNKEDKVIYGKDKKHLDSSATPHNSLVVLKDLQPDTTYYYAILTANKEMSDIYKMRTPVNPFVLKHKQNKMADIAADTILRTAGFTKGYCYILDFGEGDLGYAIAQKSDLQIVGFEKNPELAQKSRERFENAGLYGTRLIILDGTTIKNMPSKTANIITSGMSYETGVLPTYKDAEIKRLLRPNGGTMIFITPQKNKIFRRKGLNGAGNWDHIYANRGGTASSGDRLISTDMEIQWFGPPGPNRMADRHHRQMPPLYSNGNLFILGDNYLYGVDGYNGTVLWERTIPRSRRLGVMYDTGIMAATPQRVYVGSGRKCLAIGARSGEVEVEFVVPYQKEEVGYVAIDKNNLILSSQPVNASWNKVYKNNSLMEGDFRPIACSRALFSYNVDTGELRWEYRKGIIFNPAIAQSDDTIFFIESRNPELLQKPDGRFGIKDLLDGGWAFLVALNIKTGSVRWEKKLEAPFTNIIFLQYSNDIVLASGSYNVDKNVKYLLLAFDSKSGDFKWQADSSLKDAHTNGSHGEQWQHPAIVDNEIFLQGNVIDLQTGIHKKDRKVWARSGRGCGTMSCSEHFSFQRYGNPILKDLQTGEEIKLTYETRPGCWINIIPVGGMIVIPEASAGCTCGYTIQASMALSPKEGN